VADAGPITEKGDVPIFDFPFAEADIPTGFPEMNTEKRSAEAANADVAAPGCHDGLPGAFQELHRALHKASIYPPGHPAIREAIGRARDELNRALEGHSSLMIAVTRTHLLVGRSPIEGPQTLQALAEFLHDLDVAGLEIRPGLTTDELERFLLLLREARRQGKSGAALAVALAEEKLENLRIFPLDYWGLSFGSPDERERDLSAEDVWHGLVVSLTDLAPSKDGIEPEILAGTANDEFVTHEGVGGGLLRKQIQAIGRRMQAMEDWQRDALRTRLGRFVGALNPSLRLDLLRVDLKEAEGSLNVVAELADSLPDATLLEILRDINRSGKGAHNQFLNLVNKMARIPTGESSAGLDMDSVLHEWGVLGALHGESAKPFRSALKEVLMRRTDVACTSEPYQELLDDLTHREILPVTRSLVTRYRDPSDPIDVRAQTVELAVHLLQDGPGTEHAAGLLAHVGAATDGLLDAGRFQPIRNAAVIARSIGASEEESEEARRAAQGFLRDFTLEPRVDRILDRLATTESVPSAVESLLALGGAVALDRIIDRLDQTLPGHVASVLRNVAANMGRETLAQVFESRKADGWTRLRPAFPLLRLLPVRDALFLLDGLAVHPGSRVRREVLSYRCDLDPGAGAAARHLRAALGDADPRVVALAVQRLAAFGTPEAVEILGAFLEGSIHGGSPTLAHVRRVVNGMLRVEEIGLERACKVLGSLRTSLQPARVRLGAIIRQMLESHQQDPRVASCLARWRRSPAGLLSLALTPSPVQPTERAR